MMDQQVPQDGDTSTGSKALAIIGVLFATGLVFYSLRIYTHLRPANKLYSSDYIISLAVIVEIIVFSFMVVAVREGFGRHNYYVSPEESVKFVHYTFYAEVFGSWVSSLARVSVALMLLQFDMSILRRATLWIAIFIQFVVAFCLNLMLFIQCRPLRTMWETVPNAKCWTSKQTEIYSYTFDGVQMISDFAFAIMPMFFIWKLNRPLLERILISVLMALGLCATSSVIVKVYLSKTFSMAIEDTYREMLKMFVWCRVEECVLIASACAPFLKSPIEQFLGRLGVPTFKNTTIELNSLPAAGHIPKKPRWPRCCKHRELQKDVQVESQEGIILSLDLFELGKYNSKGLGQNISDVDRDLETSN